MAALALGCRARGMLLRGGTARPAAAVAAAAVCGSSVRLLSRGPDRPDTPSRNPDIYPPGWQKPDSPVPDPLNPNPDAFPPDIGTPRRDPDVLPPRYPSPDMYPPGDNPDMFPPVPGKGPFMAAATSAAALAAPLDSPKHFGPPGMSAWGSGAPGSAAASPFRRRRGSSTADLLLLKTDGGNPWMEARMGMRRGYAAAAGEHPGRGMSGEEQKEANQTRAAMEGVQKQDDDVPTQSYVAERGSTPPEVTPRVPTEAPDKLPAGGPRESLPGYTHATEPVAHIGKVSDDLGDVPEATPAHTRDIKPKVGPKGVIGIPPEVPSEVPTPGFPNTPR